MRKPFFRRGYSPTKTLSESNLKMRWAPLSMKKKWTSFKRPRLSYSMMPNWNSMILHWHFRFWIGYTIAEINIDHAIHRAFEDYSSFHAPMKLAMFKVKPPIYHWLLFVWSLSHAKLYQTPMVHNQFLKKKNIQDSPQSPVIIWFAKKNMNFIVISATNHRIHPLISQLNAIFGAPSCTLLHIPTCLQQGTSCHASQRLATWPPRRRPRGGTRSCPWGCGDVQNMCHFLVKLRSLGI